MSRSVCDVCGRPYVFGVILYSIATRFDEDTGEMVSFRHWDCYTPVENLIGELRDGIRKLDEATSALRSDDSPVHDGLPPRRRR